MLSANDQVLEFAFIFAGIVVLMVFGYISKKTDLSGSLAGGLLAALIYMGVGIPGLVYFLVFFLIGSYASKWKYQQKVKMGLAQENQGRRTAVHAFSNAGAAGFFAAITFLGFGKEFGHVAIACSFAAAMSDTLSSELGNILGTQFLNILTFETDERGKDGVVSPEGSVAGVAGSFIITLFYLVFTLDWVGSFIVFSMGIASNVIDSFLGATLQKREVLNNHGVNLVATSFAGVGGVFLSLIAFLFEIILN